MDFHSSHAACWFKEPGSHGVARKGWWEDRPAGEVLKYLQSHAEICLRVHAARYFSGACVRVNDTEVWQNSKCFSKIGRSGRDACYVISTPALALAAAHAEAWCPWQQHQGAQAKKTLLGSPMAPTGLRSLISLGWQVSVPWPGFSSVCVVGLCYSKTHVGEHPLAQLANQGHPALPHVQSLYRSCFSMKILLL